MSTIYGMTVTFGGGSVSGSTVPQVIVNAPTGSTVTAKKGDIVLTAPEKSGVWVFDLPEFGAWVITATKGTQTATQSVVFDGAKSVNLSFFSATIAVTYPAGSTCTCSNGATVLTAPDTSGSCTFIVTGAGTWTVEVTDGDNYAATDVEIINDGQAATAALSYAPVASTTAADGVSYTSGLFGLDAETVSLFAEAISNNSAITNATSVVYIDYGATHRKISVGDTMDITIDSVSHAVNILGFNHDDLSNGTAYGKATATGKAGISFQLVNCVGRYKMNPNPSNGGGWTYTDLRVSHLNSCRNSMETDLLNVIKVVNKVTANTTTEDNLFLPSEFEVCGALTGSYAGEGSQYAYYKAGNSAIKYLSGSAFSWWLRSPAASNNTAFCAIYTNGRPTGFSADDGYVGVAFAFCV